MDKELKKGAFYGILTSEGFFKGPLLYEKAESDRYFFKNFKDERVSISKEKVEEFQRYSLKNLKI